MKRIVLASAGLLALFLLGGQLYSAPQQQQETIATTTLKVGDVAPDFTLPSNQQAAIKLSDFRGKKNVILAFYVLAFTPG